MKKACFCIFSIFLIFAVFFSCEVGLGKEIDLEAPRLALSYPTYTPGSTTYVPREFTLKGTCDDNLEVKRVEIKYTYTQNGEPKSDVVRANLEGGGVKTRNGLRLSPLKKTLICK